MVKGLEEQINSFERRKLHDLKSVLLDFVTIELSFHTKALELLTKAYQDVVSIDEIKDLEVRSKFLHYSFKSCNHIENEKRKTRGFV